MQTSLSDRFPHPTSILIAGNSGSGKSFFVANLIRYQKVNPPPQSIIWFYRQYQPLYDDLLREGHPITFIEGLPDEVSQPAFFNKTLRNLCVIDDLHLEKKSAEHVAQLFCNAGRHSNTTVIFIAQNLYFKSPFGRDIRLNAKYIVAFKNPQDQLQLSLIGRQIYPGKNKFFQAAITECFKRPYGYVLLDLNQSTDDRFRIRTSIFGENGFPEVFMPVL